MKYNPEGIWETYADLGAAVLELPAGYSEMEHVLVTKLQHTWVKINGEFHFIQAFVSNYLTTTREGFISRMYYSEINTFELFLPLPGWYNTLGHDLVAVNRNIGTQYKLSFNSDMYHIGNGVAFHHIDWTTHSWVVNGKFYSSHIPVSNEILTHYNLG